MTGRGLLTVLIIYTILMAFPACDMGPGDAMDSYRGSGDPLFVAIADDGNSYISEDGKSWRVGGSIGTNTLTTVSYGQGKFVGTTNFGDPVWISSDGKNWVSYTSVETGIDSNDYLNTVSYNNGLFLVGGGFGGNAKIYYSTNGINWSLGQGIAIGSNVSKIAYSNDIFFAFPEPGAQNISISTDGKNWQDQPAPDKDDMISDVAYGNTIFVIAGVNNLEGLIRISQTGDSNNWSGNVTAGTNVTFQCILYRNKTFVAVGSKNVGSGGVVYTSENGFTWEGPFATHQSINKITYGNGMFVVVGSNGLIAYSKSGQNWSANVGPGVGISIFDVCYRP